MNVKTLIAGTAGAALGGTIGYGTANFIGEKGDNLHGGITGTVAATAVFGLTSFGAVATGKLLGGRSASHLQAILGAIPPTTKFAGPGMGALMGVGLTTMMIQGAPD